MTNMYQSLVYYAVFLFSATMHEAGHAWAAKRGGDPTAYLGGQVSLDPLPHIRREPLGLVILPLATTLLMGWPIGYASAPYDPVWAHRHPRRAAWMALAGPGANLALLVAAGLLLHAGIALGAFAEPNTVEFSRLVAVPRSGAWQAAGTLISALFSMNLLLFVLNMVPLPPLDGSGAVPLLLSPSATARWRDFIHQPMMGWVGMVVVWQMFGAFFRPVFLIAVNLLYPGAGFGH